MRIKPNFGPKDSVDPASKKDDRPGCIRISITILIGIYVVSAYVRLMSGNVSRMDQYVCLGVLLTLVIILIIGSVITNKEQRAWKARSVSAEVPIVSREFFAGGSYQISEDGDTRYSSPRIRLVVRLPDLKVVTVNVTEDIYKKLEQKNSVRIYYEPDSPSSFLLEDEINF